MITITVFNQKGGSAKTASVIGIGGGLIDRGHAVEFADGDPRGLLEDGGHGDFTIWASRRAHFQKNRPQISVTPLSLGNPDDGLREIMKKKPDYIVIDAPPGFSYDHQRIIDYSDMIIVPISVSSADYDASEDTLRQVKKITEGEGGEDILVRVLPWFRSPAKSFARSELLEELKILVGRYNWNLLIDHIIPFDHGPVNQCRLKGLFPQEIRPKSKSGIAYTDFAYHIEQTYSKKR